MAKTLVLTFGLALDRAGRMALADFINSAAAEREALVAGKLAATMRAVRTALAEMLDLSILAALANPTVNYTIDDPTERPGLSEQATAAVWLTIPTSDAHLATLADWAARPPNLSPTLFESELRAAILAATKLRN